MLPTIRKFTIPLGVFALFVALPALFSPAASATPTTSDALQEGTIPSPTPDQPDSPVGTIPPATPTTPIVFPTATPHVVIRPVSTATPMPTATSTPTPTPTSTPAFPVDALVIDGLCTDRVIGNRYNDTLYGYVGGWLYQSRDFTDWWRLITPNPQVDTFIVSTQNPNVIYSGGTACDDRDEPVAFYRSFDGGDSWTRLDTASNLRPLLVDPTDNERVFASSCDGLYLTEDGGVTWTRINADLWEDYDVVDMDFAPLTEEVAVDFGELEENERLALLDLNNLFAGGLSPEESGVVGYSTNGGTAWTNATPLIVPSPWGMHSIAVDPRDAQRFWFADDEGVWSAEDGGTRLTFSNEGLEALVNGDDEGDDDSDEGGARPFNDIFYHPNDLLYLATVDGLYTQDLDDVENGDAGWRKITGTTFEDLEILSIVFSEMEPDTLLLNTEDCVYTFEVEGQSEEVVGK